MAVGGGTALFVCGWCFCPQAADPLARVRPRRRAAAGDGARDAAAGPVPRLCTPARSVRDSLRHATRARPGSELRSYRSGFWGIVRIEPRAAARQLRAVAAGRARRTAASAERRARADPRRAPASAARCGRVARRGERRPGSRSHGDATTRPPTCSRASSSRSAPRRHENWVCVISDDCSQPERLRGARAAVGGDPRFVVSRSPRRLGLLPQLRARARAGARATPSTSRSPTRTTTGIRTSSSALLAGDRRRAARLQRRPGRRPRRRADLRDVVEPAAQQPRRPALAAGRQLGHRRRVAAPPRPARLRAAVPAGPVRPLPRSLDRAGGARARARSSSSTAPLYDYVQHGDASLGHAARQPDDLAARAARAASGACASACGCGGCTTSSTSAGCCSSRRCCEMRCGDGWRRPSAATLRRFLDDGPVAARSLALLGARGARELLGPTPETLGAEWVLFHAFAWRRLLEPERAGRARSGACGSTRCRRRR